MIPNMELICPQEGPTYVNSTLIETVPAIPNDYVDNGTFLQILKNSEPNTDLSSTSNVTRQREKLPEWNYGTFTRRIAIPLLCVFGIIGNILNGIILTRKIKEGKTSKVWLDNCHKRLTRLISGSNKIHYWLDLGSCYIFGAKFFTSCTSLLGSFYFVHFITWKSVILNTYCCKYI